LISKRFLDLCGISHPNLFSSIAQEMDDGERILPTYLVYLTTLAFKTFVEEQVDVAVIEVGLGGRFDHTNLVEDPAVTVVTGIHLEHTERLGNTIEEIAWNKAGIFKPGVPAVIAHNIAAGAMRVFEHEAELVKCPLFVAPSLHELRSWTANDPKVLSQLDACIKDLPVSRSTEINAPLALAAVYLWSSRSAVCRENIDFKPLVFDGLSGLQPPLSFGLDAKQLQVRLPSKASQAERCLSAWRSLTTDALQTPPAPAHILENSAALLRDLKKWRSKNGDVPALLAYFGSEKVLSKGTTVQVLGTGSVYLVGDILKASLQKTYLLPKT
uniref:Mur_ligase_M domain-containing protein n=1 Tax=Schistocephalus solidus TaxID=70667 RepID=A0A183TDT6_SCHSO